MENGKAVLSKRQNRVMERFFLIVGFLFGMYCSLMLPVGMTPDEYTHLQKMEQGFGTSSYTQETVQAYDWDWRNGIIQHNKHVNVKEYEKRGEKYYSKPLHLTDFHPEISILQYLPAGIGYYLSVALHLPIFYCMQVAELFSLLFYLLMGYLTLRVAPFRKEIFLFCLLMPMTVQQVSSINYDSVLIPVCFFLTAYVLRLCVDDEKIVTWRDVILVGFLSLVIAVVKIPYVVLAGMVFMIPHDRIRLKIGRKNLMDFIWRFRWFLAVLCVLGVAGLFYRARQTFYVKTLIACLLQPGRFVLLLRFSLSSLKDFFLRSFVGDVGWLDASISFCTDVIFFVVLFYLELFLHGEERETFQKITRKDKIWMVLMYLIISVTIFISMVTWSIRVYGLPLNGSVSEIRQQLYQIEIIQGVQGRYFIPAFPMLLMALFGSYDIQSRKKYIWTQIIFYAFMIFEFTHLIWIRYWS